MEMDLLFGLISLGCGLYCLYASYMMKKTGIIFDSLLLDKVTASKKCKNVGEFITMVLPATTTLGITIALYGGVTLIDAYVTPCYEVVMILLVISLIVIVWYAIRTNRAKKMYF